jgi:hypothetical protein
VRLPQGAIGVITGEGVVVGRVVVVVGRVVVVVGRVVVVVVGRVVVVVVGRVVVVVVVVRVVVVVVGRVVGSVKVKTVILQFNALYLPYHKITPHRCKKENFHCYN